MLHRSRASVVALAVVAALLLPAAMPAVGALGAAPPPNAVVGFAGRAVDLGLLAQLGATVTGSSDALGLAAVAVPNVASFAAAAAAHPGIAWVDDNDAIAMSSSGWDSSGWDSSGWDSSGWDSSGWDSSGWDSSGWDSSGWDSSGWDSSGWDSSGWDSSGWDSSGWDSSGWDSSGWDSSGWDSSGWDPSGWDSSGWDSSGWDSASMTAFGAAPGAPGTDPLVAWQWGLAASNATRADLTPATPPKTICVVDSGVDASHPDLAGRVLPGYDFVNKDADASDDAGHGTHVAGIAAAVTGNGKGLAGMSHARILPVKVLAANGVGLESDLAFGIEWCRAHGADVISMSLGTPENSKAVHRAVVDAFADGIVLVASAGNTGACGNCVQWPAAYPQVLSIGAVTPGGTRAPFSAVSDGVDFAAPGYAIVSTLPAARYGTASGTSQAAPFAAALAALLLSQGLDAHAATQAMKASAKDLGPAGKDPFTGHGALDFGAALA